MRQVNLKRRAQIGQLRRLRTRAVIIDRALQVVAEKGFAAPTIDDFVAAARVARGTFYNYFETREQFLAAIAAWVVDEVDRELLPIYSVIEDPAQRVAIALRHFVRTSEARPVWGWVIVHMLPIAGGPLSKEMRRGLVADLTTGQRSGRFVFHSIEAALALALGVLLMAIRTTLSGNVPADFAISMAAMVFQAFGMPQTEAWRIASLPMPAIWGDCTRAEADVSVKAATRSKLRGAQAKTW